MHCPHNESETMHREHPASVSFIICVNPLEINHDILMYRKSMKLHFLLKVYAEPIWITLFHCWMRQNYSLMTMRHENWSTHWLMLIWLLYLLQCQFIGSFHLVIIYLWDMGNIFTKQITCKGHRIIIMYTSLHLSQVLTPAHTRKFHYNSV